MSRKNKDRRPQQPQRPIEHAEHAEQHGTLTLAPGHRLTEREAAQAVRNTAQARLIEQQIKTFFGPQIDLIERNREQLREQIEERIGGSLYEFDLTEDGELIPTTEPGAGNAAELTLQHRPARKRAAKDLTDATGSGDAA